MIILNRLLWHSIGRFGIIFLCSMSYVTLSGQKYVMSTVEGLDPSIEIRHTLTDSLGYLWIATDNGIWRYDGSELISYYEELRSHDIRSMIYTSNDVLLFCSDEGLMQIDPYQQVPKFSNFLRNNESMGKNQLHYPKSLFEDTKNRIWIVGERGQLGVLISGRYQSVPIGGLCNSASHDISIEEVRGEIFIYGGPACVYKIDNQFQSIPIRVDGDLSELRGIKALKDELYLYGRGIYKARIVQNGRRFILNRAIETVSDILTIVADGDIIYAGTAEDGLKRIDYSGLVPEFTNIFMANDPHRVNELPLTTVNSINISEGNIWLGSTEGVALLQRRYFETINALPNLNIIDIYHDGEVTYVGMGGLYRIDRNYEDLNTVLTGMCTNYSANAIQRQGQTLWVGTTTGELLGYQNEILVRSLDLTERGSGIFNLQSDLNGNMWIIQSPLNDPIIGLAKMRPDGTIVEYGRDKGLNERMLAIDESTDGQLYVAGIGVSSLLYRYNSEQDSFYNLSLPLQFDVSDNFEVHDLDVDENGIVWLATTDGLIRYDIDRYTRIDLGPYTTTEIRGIAAMNDQSYWIATDTYGFLNYDGNQYVLLDESTGLGSKISSYRCINIDPLGRVWAGTAEGLVYTRNPDPEPQETKIPRLISITSSGHIIEKNNRGNYCINDRGRTQIKIKCVEYPGKLIEYRYRIMDKFGAGDWVSLGVNSDLILSDPDKRMRGIEVAAKNPIGRSWSKNLFVPLKVIQPWYRKTWGYTLIGIAVLGGFIVFFRFNLRKLMHRVRQLESALAISEKEYLEAKNEKIEDKHRLDFILKLTEILKKKLSEKELIRAIGEALDASFDLDIIEIGIYNRAKDIIEYYGYDSTLDVITEREEEFMFKDRIGAYSIHHNETLLFQDYVSQHGSFVTPEEDEHPYASQITIPFELKDRRKAILHVGAEVQGRFEQRDVEMFVILTTMIDSIDIKIAE